MKWIVLTGLIFTVAHEALAQNPPPPPPASRGAGAQGGRGGGGGGGRGRGIVAMTLSTTAWTNGATIPVKYSQAGAEVSPPLAWTDVPDGTQSFVLLAYNANAVSGATMEGQLHWLLWNIPGSARSLPEGVPQGPQLQDGTRQLSMSGPYYRGPAAPATSPPHTYVFELYALDTLVNVESVGMNVTVAGTRAAVLAAMQGRVRGKAIMTGTFRRPE